ncbi:MAG TPA: glycosyltransferase family 2 protein [Pyrinomonadaceae bacterium]|jgi:cellulose synthase/poly-beta-1,6-N-acetylglucosamine synthase-like glycosyltransferase
MWLFYLFAGLLVLQGIVSLRGGVRWLAYVRRELARPLPTYAPYASVVVPCRGLDQGLAENLRAVCRQDYPRYEVIFVTDAADDPALAVVESVRAECATDDNPTTRVVVAGRATDRGQKVYNLLAGLAACAAGVEVFVFVDTDARPQSGWLRALVAPLADAGLGATTGYRWFVPVRGGLASHLRAVWNASIASALGADAARNFCWGGATALRRATFHAADVPAYWRGALSDDFALTRALKAAGRAIRFVPQCLTAAHEDCTLTELCEFTTRQMKITRVYAPHLWRIVLGSNLLFVLVFFGGVLLALARLTTGASFWPPLVLVGVIYLLGAAKAALRLRAVALALAPAGVRFGGRTHAAHPTLWPLTAALYAGNALAAALSRRLDWRGIAYELKSPNETIVQGERRRAKGES